MRTKRPVIFILTLILLAQPLPAAAAASSIIPSTRAELKADRPFIDLSEVIALGGSALSANAPAYETAENKTQIEQLAKEML